MFYKVANWSQMVFCDAAFNVAICHSFILICCPLKCPEKLEDKFTSVIAIVSERKSFILCGYRIAPIDFTGVAVRSHAQSTHRLALATFWRTFHHDGKFSPAWWGWGVHADPLSLYSIYHHVQRCKARSSWEGRYTPVESGVIIICIYVRSLSVSFFIEKELCKQLRM